MEKVLPLNGLAYYTTLVSYSHVLFIALDPVGSVQSSKKILQHNLCQILNKFSRQSNDKMERIRSKKVL